MNKTAIKNFAIWARKKLIADVSYQAGLLGITEAGIAKALPQSFGTTEFYDIGIDEPYEITGEALRQRRSLTERIRRKEADTDYATAYQYMIEEVAYTWFNRLIAVRFMEVNDYLPARIRVLSSESGKIEPDLVTNPFDAELDLSVGEETRIMQWKTDNKLDELFQMLFIKQCNALNAYLPALFEKTNDYTELLLNLSVIDQDGVVWHLVHDIPEDDFNVERGGQVEIIGWLYQYYNTEPKDAVFKRPSGQKIKKEEVPAATQLFTPDWIVRYMVENSLGRLWIEKITGSEGPVSPASPASPTRGGACEAGGGVSPEQQYARSMGWKYYIPEAEQEPEVQEQLDEIRKERSRLNPEDLTCIDPCMGSGHILVYLFDVLMQIYESQGYSQRDAAQSILVHNLYGLDIDDRAAQMAYFAVMMKARQYDRRILTRGIEPHVCAIPESNEINRGQLKYFGADLSGSEKETAAERMIRLLDEMKDAKEYGSALQIPSYDWDLLERFAEGADDAGQYSFESMNLDRTQEQLQELIKVAKMLAGQYQVAVTNPPYMGGSGMSPKLSKYVKNQYPGAKSDMSTVFMVRTLSLCKNTGYVSMINIPVWMFLSSYEKLRGSLIINNTFVDMVHPGRGIFGSDFGTTAFVFAKKHVNQYQGTYCRLFDQQGEVKSIEERERVFLSGENRYIARQENFSKIPGSPVAYWASEAVIHAFTNFDLLGSKFILLAGTSTGDNTLYQRNWFEVPVSHISKKAPDDLTKRWYPCNTGGEFRKYSLNSTVLIDWENDGKRIRNHINSKGKIGSAVRNRLYFFKTGLTWNKLSSSNFGVRFVPPGYISDDTARMIMVESEKMFSLLGFLCSKVCKYFLELLSPTLSFTNSELQRLPLSNEIINPVIEKNVLQSLSLSTNDGNDFETSWDFLRHPMLTGTSALAAWESWKASCETRFQTLKSNEEELNRIFIDIYGLQDELTPDVADKDVTVRRLFDSKDDIPEEMRGGNYAVTKRDAVVSLISYAVGCMFGRYSLDVDGLAYAGGDWDDSKYSAFIPDEDNCIPISDEEYFKDDIVGLFCAWMRAAFGEEQLEKNLDFIAEALGNKGRTSREVIRNYFLKDFYKDHCKTYQKRPIYWLFDSGKQNGFKALVYMHRWTADTIGTVNADYLLRSQRVYESEMGRMQDMADHSQNPREIAAASKRKEKLSKQLKECKEYYEKLSHLALERIDIDLDDGVKVNYRKVQTGSDGKFYEVLADSKNIMAKK